MINKMDVLVQAPPERDGERTAEDVRRLLSWHTVGQKQLSDLVVLYNGKDNSAAGPLYH